VTTIAIAECGGWAIRRGRHHVSSDISIWVLQELLCELLLQDARHCSVPVRDSRRTHLLRQGRGVPPKGANAAGHDRVTTPADDGGSGAGAMAQRRSMGEMP
jgi:hypothetical protein